MRSTSRSKCSRIRGSVRAPNGDSSKTSRARLNAVLALSRWPSCSSFWPASKWRVEIGNQIDNWIGRRAGRQGSRGGLGDRYGCLRDWACDGGWRMGRASRRG